MGTKPNQPIPPNPNDPNPLPQPNPPLPAAEALPTDFDAAIEEIIKLRQLLANAKGLLAQADDLANGYKAQLEDAQKQQADSNTLIEQYLKELAKKG